ncbi:hypothetical protein JAAARDRAFT_164568 [Jaapia argillacea MUCL 33604]|uniref:Actin interacting protein 3 C-terminal domain-containing protein n=1 Tax=Jaapia argillacea MUCL 33604 TaxID=933084 RepID=A0A067PJZ0_9AGAM|nr:hypothetical protein JAAARDRAFT_164568 [Jaapia argillacea MUCL 33604]
MSTVSTASSSSTAPPPYPGHASRRDNQSVSSNHSASRSERGSRGRGNPAVESTVTKLLVSIKALLESLTMWSQGKMTETEVSDVYVRLGNDFNAAVSAFAVFGISMDSDMMNVPEQLREVLETCLAEDATPANLNKFLPQVRGIITSLLTGLRAKQSLYRKMASEHRPKSTDSSATGHERTDSRSSRSDRMSERMSARDGLNGSRRVPPMREGDGQVGSEGPSRSSATLSRRREPSTRVASTSGESDDRFVGGFVHPTTIPDPHSSSAHSQPDRTSSISTNTIQSQSRRQPSLPANGYFPAPSPPVPEEPDQSSKPPDAIPERVGSPPLPAGGTQAPQGMKRYSLVDKPMTPPPPPPAVIIEDVTPSNSEDHFPDSQTPPPPPRLDSPPLETTTPAVASSLAALKKSDTLERRASKRFSQFNISRMTGSISRDRSLLGGGGTSGGQGGNRKSFAAASSNLTPGDLAVLTEEGEEGEVEEVVKVKRTGSTGSRRQRVGPRGPSPLVEEEYEHPPPMPRLPSVVAPPEPPGRQALHPPNDMDKPVPTTAPSATPSELPPSTFTVFLQLGREVKKVTIEPGISFSSLRVLFVDKFSYNPGQDDFPAIYIRDPASGVQYELEDTDEVKDKCLLSLNIEPLDQIKQHIDAQISTLSQDIKDLRTIVSSNRRSSLPPPMIMGQPLGESTPTRPTDRQFQTVARRLSRIVTDDNHHHQPPPPPSQFNQMQPIMTQMTGQSLQPQMTGGSVLSEYTGRVVNDLKTQFDEVQNLRRDLGIMRQLYTEFIKQTKESLGTLRTQTQNVRQLATANVGGARQYIDDGKAKLDVRSQNVLTKMEELQDLVEGMKDDVIKRHITPKPQVLKGIKSDIDTVTAELNSLKEHIKTVKPMWKKTWAEELQNIVEEQQFLNHQEEFLGDLLEDHKAVLEVYGHVEKVISLRGSGSGGQARRLRSGGANFRPPPPEEGHNGLTSVMLEIRNAAVDPERRMKAIEANQKNREKTQAQRGDEFEAELSGFVAGKKLKMTGGAEEAERVRKKRDELALKAMFTGGSATGALPMASPSGSAPPTPSTAYMTGTEADDES